MPAESSTDQDQRTGIRRKIYPSSGTPPKRIRAYERKLLRSARDLADAHKETIRVRNYWFQVLEDMLREFEEAQRNAARELEKMEKRALDAEKQRDDALDKAKEFRQ